MRSRSIAGPVILVLIGAFLLWVNIRPQIPAFELAAVYWPFLLIAWGVLRLIEVLVAAARGRSYPRSGGGEVAIVVLLCIFGSAAFAAYRHGIRFGPHMEFFGEQYDYPITVQAPAGNARRIVFDHMRGNLRVSGSDGTEIRINGRKTIRAISRQEADRANRVTPVEVNAEGDSIIVRTNQERIAGDRRIAEDLEISVPRNMSLTATARSGDFDVMDLAGDVKLASDKADVRLNKIGGSARVDLQHSDLVRAIDVKGNLELQGGGKDIEMENIAGQVTIGGSYSGTLQFSKLAKPLHFASQHTDLRVASLPGRITMDLSDFTASNLVGPIRLVTRSRDVKIADFTDSLELETERGDVELQPSRVPLSRIDARCRAGSFDLVLPEKAAFQLKATTERGEAINDFGPAIRSEAQGRAATLEGKVGSGASITITIERGTIAVRKAGAEPERTKL